MERDAEADKATEVERVERRRASQRTVANDRSKNSRLEIQDYLWTRAFGTDDGLYIKEKTKNLRVT